MTIDTHSPDETVRLGERLAAQLVPGDVLAMTGELGSGKTMLTKGVASGLGVASAREVTSPTFVLMTVYDDAGDGPPLHHYDAYRLGSGEFDGLDGGEGLASGAVSVVEWADRVAASLPERRIDVGLEAVGETFRRITFTERGGREALAWSRGTGVRE